MKIHIMLFILIVIVGVVSAEVRINEVELNPNDDCNDCSEWIELYSDSEINLTNWNITDSANDVMELNFTINGYYVLTSTISLRNGGENLTLTNTSGDIVDQIFNFEDIDNTNETWQYCNGAWNFSWFTPGSVNNCSTPGSDPELDDDDDDIYVELEWDDEEIINGEEFEIKVKAYHLENKWYKIKVWIEDDDGNTITERYGIDNKGIKEWKAGTYWAYEFIEGSGDESEDIKLKIRSSYNNFYGDATIFVSIEENDSSANINEEDYDIEILEQETTEENEDDEEVTISTTSVTKSTTTSNAVIKLGSSSSENNIKENIKADRKNSIIYKSKNEYIKEWSVYAFGFICIGIIVLLLIDKN